MNLHPPRDSLKGIFGDSHPFQSFLQRRATPGSTPTAFCDLASSRIFRACSSVTAGYGPKVNSPFLTVIFTVLHFPMLAAGGIYL